MGCRLTLFLCVIFHESRRTETECEGNFWSNFESTTLGLGSAAKLNFCAINRI